MFKKITCDFIIWETDRRDDSWSALPQYIIHKTISFPIRVTHTVYNSEFTAACVSFIVYEAAYFSDIIAYRYTIHCTKPELSYNQKQSMPINYSFYEFDIFFIFH